MLPEVDILCLLRTSCTIIVVGNRSYIDFRKYPVEMLITHASHYVNTKRNTHLCLYMYCYKQMVIVYGCILVVLAQLYYSVECSTFC